MDRLIPAGDGMPAASQAGAMEYLDHLAAQNEQVANELRGSLDALEEVSHDRFKVSFMSLSEDLRVESLIALEQRQPNCFRSLRDYVCEAYYLQPRVRHLIGYEFHPTNGPGPMFEPFDESVLAQVSRKPRHYREV